MSAIRKGVASLFIAATLVLPGTAQTPPSPPAAPPAIVSEPRTGTPPSPVDEFAKQVDDLKKSLDGFNSQIESKAKAIGDLLDAGKVKKEIESLRAIVAGALGAVSDDSKVAQLGVQALKHAKSKIEQLEKDLRFTKEQRDFLLGEWKRIAVDTEKASEDLEKARKEFVQLLKVLQTREDFVDELLQVQKAREAVEIIKQLSTEIRTASDALKNLIRAIKPPGA